MPGRLGGASQRGGVASHCFWTLFDRGVQSRACGSANRDGNDHCVRRTGDVQFAPGGAVHSEVAANGLRGHDHFSRVRHRPAKPHDSGTPAYSHLGMTLFGTVALIERY